MYFRINIVCKVFLLVLFFAFLTGNVDAQKKKHKRSMKLAREYYVIADSLYMEALYDSAASYYEMAGEIFEKRSMWLDVAKCYQLGGECYYLTGQADTALVLANKSLNLINLHKLKNNIDGLECFLGTTLLLGKINYFIESYDISLANFNVGVEFIDTLSSNDNSTFIISSRPIFLKYAGLVYTNQGDYDNALKTYNQAIEILIILEGENSYYVAQIYSNIGNIYLYKEDYENTYLFFSNAKKILQNLYGQESLEYANILLSFGTLYKSQKEHNRAKKCLLRVLNIYNQKLHSDDIRFAFIYNNLAEIYLKEKLYSKASEYYKKARDLFINRFGEESSLVAFIDNNIALMYFGMGEYTRAIPYFENALLTRTRIYGEKHFRVAQTNYYLGRNYLKMLQVERSLKIFQQALIALCPEFKDTSLLSNPDIELNYKEIDIFNILCWKANALYLLYKIVPEKTEYLLASYETYKYVLTILDIIRKDYSAWESQLIFSGNNKQKLLYATYVFDEMLKVYSGITKEDYLILSEKLKGFVLFTSSNESKIKELAGIPDSLLEYENNLRRELSYQKTKDQRYKYMDRQLDSAKIEETENKIFCYNKSYDSLIMHYEVSYPKYFELKYKSSIPSITDIQSKLSSSEIIIDYLINDTLLYIFTISDDDFNITKTVIDADFTKRVIDYFRLIKKAGNDFQFANESSYLYNKLIFPVRGSIKDKKKLIIIPDEILAYIPFETLIDEEDKYTADVELSSLDYLINDFEIVYNYSVSLWWNARIKRLRDNENTPFKNSFVGFAPVFNNVKGDIKNDSIGFDSVRDKLVQRSFSLDRNRFQELLYTRDEVEQINDLFKQKNKGGRVYLDNYATKSNFIMTIKDYKYVHIATHGFSNDKYPGLSGLAFYPNGDSINANAKDDLYNETNFYSKNILFSSEMYNLDINADLLVLSACETGIGKLAKGEGLLAMTRGFLYSGVNNIVFSLWKVNDKYTKDLMIRFYREILSGKSYSNALKLAKLYLLKKTETSHPIFWSSFLLIGE